MYTQRHILLGLVLSCALNSPAWAALSLSVAPAEGGASLRFSQTDVRQKGSKEVRLRITSTDGQQYQVYQRLIEPLVNERGEGIDPQSFLAYNLTGSNSQGTLYQQDISTLGVSDQILYTSNPSGDSDAFTVIYVVDPAQMRASGEFAGKIAYTVRSTAGGIEENSFLVVNITAAGELEIDSQASSGVNLVRISSQRAADQEGYVRLNLSGALGGGFKVTQEVLEYPRNLSGRELGGNVLRFAVEAAQGQVMFDVPTSFERRPVKIYETEGGEAQIAVKFSLDAQSMDKQTAGLYAGKLLYKIETGETQREIPINLEVEISPVFEINVRFPEGGIKFSELLPGAGPQLKEADVTVNSNLGRPYMVTQSALAGLTNERGDILETGAFALKVDLADGASGKPEFAEFSPVPPGETPVFYSDNAGSSAAFKIIYRLNPYPAMVAGEYTTTITFSLGEI